MVGPDTLSATGDPQGGRVENQELGSLVERCLELGRLTHDGWRIRNRTSRVGKPRSHVDDLEQDDAADHSERPTAAARHLPGVPNTEEHDVLPEGPKESTMAAQAGLDRIQELGQDRDRPELMIEDLRRGAESVDAHREAYEKERPYVELGNAQSRYRGAGDQEREEHHASETQIRVALVVLAHRKKSWNEPCARRVEERKNVRLKAPFPGLARRKVEVPDEVTRGQEHHEHQCDL